MTTSSPRNLSKTCRALGFAATASLLLGSAAQAADESHPFILTAYVNAPGGPELVSGNYEAAVTALRSYRLDPFMSEPSALKTNLCIAYAKLKQWDSAHDACDAAVKTAQNMDLPVYMTNALVTRNNYSAVALSNRAVLHWLSADSAAAASDLHKAETLVPNADFVARNLDALHASHNTVAQVAVAPTT
jgi:Flp pilus assembly protein TadD